jgi:cytochrome b subunit of formate dehydrogenase
MFKTISIIAFVVLLVGLAIDHTVRYRRRAAKDQEYSCLCPLGLVRKLVYLLTLLLLEQRLSLLGRLRKLIFLLAILCFLVLGVTGFYSALGPGTELGGYLLMIHVSAGGAFAACMALLTLMWANRCRFNTNDARPLLRIVGREPKHPEVVGEPELGRKILFWLLAVLSLPLILSVVLSMFPLAGTDWQVLLADTHRWSALAFATAGIWYIYILACDKKKGP